MDPRYDISSKTQWPAFRASHQFWRDTALHIQESTCSSVLLTSTRIRARVFNSLKGKFPKLEDAEEFYNLTLSSCLLEMEQTSAPRGIAVPQSTAGMVDKVTQTPAHQESATITKPEPAQHPVWILLQLYLPWMRLS
ncbi:hypothetical protein OS493_024315 [Desmophyllum pertusum]|uniref:Uncharacterized protein n=1 Tax=Desmophyllum pertusum TaxID=174260 RepID=A0A9X0CQF7_9CNID|nr:hypothetical protein OS493_024315 [Desmophyllum pertusum]